MDDRPIDLEAEFNLIDMEEFDIVREDLSLVGYNYKSVSPGLPCPRCQSLNTAYAIRIEWDGWYCHKCGLIFTRYMSNIFADLEANDKEEKRLEERWY